MTHAVQSLLKEMSHYRFIWSSRVRQKKENHNVVLPSSGLFWKGGFCRTQWLCASFFSNQTLNQASFSEAELHPHQAGFGAELQNQPRRSSSPLYLYEFCLLGFLRVSNQPLAAEPSDGIRRSHTFSSGDRSPDASVGGLQTQSRGSASTVEFQHRKKKIQELKDTDPDSASKVAVNVFISVFRRQHSS